MVSADNRTNRSAAAVYRIIRSAAAVYRVQAPLVLLSGDGRLGFLDSFLSRSSDFVDPDTTREMIALNADGSPFALLCQLEGDSDTWLLPRTSLDRATLEAYLSRLPTPAGVNVQVAPDGWGAIAIEGPLAPQVAQEFVDCEIEDVLLHSIVDVARAEPGSSQARLARVGTTGEFGYLILTTTPQADFEHCMALAEALGGGAASPDGLARVQAEAGMPYYGLGFGGLTVAEADLSWIVDWNRLGKFFGSDSLRAPTTMSARLTPLALPPGHAPSPGTPVSADGREIGRIVWTAAPGNDAEELAFAVLDSPFCVPSLPVQVGDTAAMTVTLPRVVARSTRGAS